MGEVLYSGTLPPSSPKGILATSGKFPAGSFFFLFLPQRVVVIIYGPK